MARSMIARQNIKLNLVPGGVPPVLNVSQYDSAYDVHFTIYNGAQLFEIPDDVSIQFQETKRDGNGFTVGATKSAQTGQCYIWMQEQMSAVPGDQICELVLTNTTEDQIGTANFIMRVEPAALNKNTVISESEIAYANQVLAQLGSVAAYKAQLDAQGNEIDQLNTNLAAEVAARQAADNTLQSNINSEASTRATADAALQSQINQLIAPEGSAPSAAEVENARVGADGTVYPTLGDAIRGQVTDVKTALDDSTNTLGIAGTQFSVGANTVHPSSANKVNIGIKNGEKYLILVTTTGRNNFTLFEFGADGVASSNGNITKNRLTEVTASKDVAEIGLYINAIEESATYDVFVMKKTNVLNANSPQAFLTNGKAFDFSNKTLTFEADVNIVSDGSYLKTISVADIVSAANGAGFATTTNSFTATGNAFTLYYDTLLDAVVVSATCLRNDLTTPLKDKTILFAYTYGSFWGILADLYVKQQISVLKASMATVTNELNAVEDYADISKNPEFEQGWIDASGNLVTDTTRCRTKDFYSTADYSYVVMSGFNGYIDYFNADYSLGDYWSISSGVQKDIIKTYPYFKLLARTANPDSARTGTILNAVNVNLYKHISRDSDSVVANNHDLDLIFENLVRRVNVNAGDYLNAPQTLCLLHFSDIHGSENVKRIMQYKAYKGDKINDIICTGDIVYSHYTDPLTFWTNTDGIEDVLICMGNHDQSLSGNYDNALSEADAYTKYFAPYIADWGVTYTAGKTYWYKDYANNNIRLISINSNYANDADQLAFLVDALAGAKTLGYTVVCMAHFPVFNHEKINCNFTGLDREVGTYVIGDAYMSAVQDFIDGGGDFACWLGGHTHCDFVVKSTTYPDQIGIVVTCAYTSSTYSDQARENYRHSQDAFNIVGIDVNSHTIKLMRIGADSDCYMRSRKTLCINYKTQTILAQN